MKFGYDLSLLLKTDERGIATITSGSLPKVSSVSLSYNPKNLAHEKMADLLDSMGRASAEIQGLSSPITSFQKLANSPHRLYAKLEGNKIVGYIKVGEKNLCYRHIDGKFTDISAVSVLDFFVHPSVQRRGYGKELFESMLVYEKTTAQRLAYDRPSFKFKAFLARHYALDQYVAQVNHFVVFDKFFNKVNDQNLPENLKSKKLVPILEPLVGKPSLVHPPKIEQSAPLSELSDSNATEAQDDSQSRRSHIKRFYETSRVSLLEITDDQQRHVRKFLQRPE